MLFVPFCLPPAVDFFLKRIPIIVMFQYDTDDTVRLLFCILSVSRFYLLLSLFSAIDD